MLNLFHSKIKCPSVPSHGISAFDLLKISCTFNINLSKKKKIQFWFNETLSALAEFEAFFFSMINFNGCQSTKKINLNHQWAWVVWKIKYSEFFLPCLKSHSCWRTNRKQAQGKDKAPYAPPADAPRTWDMTVTKSLSAQGPSREEPREFFKGLKLMSLNTFALREFGYCLQKQRPSCNFNFSPPRFNNIWIHFSNTFLITKKTEIPFLKQAWLGSEGERRGSGAH